MSHCECIDIVFLLYVSDELFQRDLIIFVEGVEVVAVDVQNPDDGTVLDEGHHNLGTAEAATGDMAWKSIYIRNDESAAFCPCCAADTTAVFDARAGHGTLEGPEMQPSVLFHQIETYPEKAKGLVQGGAGVGQRGDEVLLSLDERLVIFQEGLVALTLGEMGRVGEGGLGHRDN